MSYEEFRRRIDTARQILVGAVPSPAGQIDQITYALIYKFMNDIDDQSAALGGKRTYFVGDYAKFNWNELMSSQLGAHERLELYREAIQTMAKNENLPELFRSIYQNAFLPFNSANVLTLFLKEIDKFSHGESDDIGDAYEYLLSITGAQGDVGQFRTPRHIIKFIVEAVNPTKDDKVLDPAVGTAGFLIAAYNHVRSQHDGKTESGEPNDEKRLTADELHKIHHNYRGFDIDPTMVRTAKINMYLHGFKTPDIINHDSLSSEEYWNDWYDVILANPPFMTPKGGIQPHKKFSITANRAEVLFVDYIASHLKPNGRAGIVVPEGIIFQSGKAYKELRKNLVENYLYAVVSLPAGVFQPYSGVKTSVLLFDKELAKRRDEILFVKVENDGYSLGAQRRKITGDQLPDTLRAVLDFKDGKEIQSDFAHVVTKSEIATSGDFNLTGDRYKVQALSDSSHELIEFGSVFEVSGKDKAGAKEYPVMSITMHEGLIDQADRFKSGIASKDTSKYKVVHRNELVVGFPIDEGVLGFQRKYEAAIVSPAYDIWRLTGESADISYLERILRSDPARKLYAANMQGAVSRRRSIPRDRMKTLKIPLPLIEIQREIVAELDGYQKIIDAAQTIVQTYESTIEINPEWGIVELGEVAELYQPKTITSKEIKDEGAYKVFGANGVIGYYSQYNHEHPEVAVTCRGATCGTVNYTEPKSWITGNAMVVSPKNTDSLSKRFLYYILQDDSIKNAISGSAQPQITRSSLAPFKIPLPPIETQREIVAELEAEQKLIDANKKLIVIYQQKIKSKIAEVWGE